MKFQDSQYMMVRYCVLVCGGRDYTYAPGDVFTYLDWLHKTNLFTEVIHGAAPGADFLAGEWAKSRGLKVTPYPADWKGLGAGAGPKRNQQMIDEGKPNLVVAFPGGRGTSDMVRRAKEHGLSVFVVRDDI